MERLSRMLQAAQGMGLSGAGPGGVSLLFYCHISLARLLGIGS